MIELPNKHIYISHGPHCNSLGLATRQCDCGAKEDMQNINDEIARLQCWVDVYKLAADTNAFAFFEALAQFKALANAGETVKFESSSSMRYETQMVAAADIIALVEELGTKVVQS